MSEDPRPDPAAALVAPDGLPLSQKVAPGPCPRCGAPPTKRVASQGFGRPHDVCRQCGYDFQESTV